jgi:hypothetical protein
MSGKSPRLPPTSLTAICIGNYSTLRITTTSCTNVRSRRWYASTRQITTFSTCTRWLSGTVPRISWDTAASPDLKTDHKLEASVYMERFDVRQEYKDDWLQQLAAGKTYVNPGFEEDDYGTFLTGDSPIYDSQGRYSGFVGVDFDLEYY